MELNRITADKEESSDWKEAKKRQRAQSDPSPHKPEADNRWQPLRSPKPPLEFTPEKTRIANGPCKWHKKGICDWKDYCTMDHSAVAMAKIPAPQPRPPPKSVRNASAVNPKEDENAAQNAAIEAITERFAQRLALLEGKLALMFRVTVPSAGVRAASIPRPTSYLAAVKSHLSRTEVWSRPTNDKMRAPGYLAALRKDLEMVRINQGMLFGPSLRHTSCRRLWMICTT